MGLLQAEEPRTIWAEILRVSSVVGQAILEAWAFDLEALVVFALGFGLPGHQLQMRLVLPVLPVAAVRWSGCSAPSR